MSDPNARDVTNLLLESQVLPAPMSEVTNAEPEEPKANVANQLFVALYDDFHRLAGRFLRSEPTKDKLTTASLVHEAYMRLVDQTRVDWQGRTHFFAVGARVMRRVLVDHARKTNAQKRGGEWTRTQLHEDVTFQMNRCEDVVMLDDLLTKLESLNPKQAQIVEQRFFAGMTMKEISEEMKIGMRTVEKEWAIARSWLRRQLREDADDGNQDHEADDTRSNA